MARRISRNKIELIVSMYCGGMSKYYIARELGVSYRTVVFYSEAGSPVNYLNEFAQKKGFKNVREYQISLVKKKDLILIQNIKDF